MLIVHPIFASQYRAHGKRAMQKISPSPSPDNISAPVVWLLYIQHDHRGIVTIHPAAPES
jgi:hypothetical protein